MQIRRVSEGRKGVAGLRDGVYFVIYIHGVDSNVYMRVIWREVGLDHVMFRPLNMTAFDIPECLTITSMRDFRLSFLLYSNRSGKDHFYTPFRAGSIPRSVVTIIDGPAAIHGTHFALKLH